MPARIDFAPYLNVKTATLPVFSADGSRLYYLSDITGTLQVWTVPVEGGWPDQLTFYEERVTGIYAPPAGDGFIFTRDLGGNEQNQIYLLHGDADQGVQITTLREDFKVKNMVGPWSPDGSTISFASNERDPAYFDIYTMPIHEDATPEQVARLDAYLEAADWSPSGRYLLFMRAASNIDHELFLVDLQESAEPRSLTAHLGKAMFLWPQFSADEQGIYVVSDVGRDFTALCFLDLETLSLTEIVGASWDVVQSRLSPDGKKLAYSVNEGGRFTLTIRDLPTGVDQLVQGLPEGTITNLAWDRSSSRLAFDFNSPIHNPDVWTYDLAAQKVWQVTHSPRGGLDPSPFSMPELIHYPTFDGLEIPALWYLPRGARPDQTTPVILYVHGGPESQVTYQWSGIFQYFLRRGFAVLAPNVRGSMGYGKHYLGLDDVRKRGDSVTDLSYAVRWLHDNGYADPKKIAVYGGSYGGFMVLAALTTFPDLWAAGVDIVGIANLVTFLENTSSYRRKLREAEYGSLEQDHEFLVEISPIHRMDRVSAPLMVIHGAQDPRVPVGEAEQVVESLRSRGRPVEYQRFEDEGHGITKLKNKLICYPKVADFLDGVMS